MNSIKFFGFVALYKFDSSSLVGEDFRGCWEALQLRIKEMAMHDETLQDMVYGLWRIWKCRNDVVLNGKPWNLMEAMWVSIG